MKLAELFGVNLSASINYKFFYRKFCPDKLRQQIYRYGLTYAELSKLTGYTESRISESVRMRPRGTALCLSAVLEVLKSEMEAYKFRNKICRNKTRRS
ncbi:MAG: hypothetical protein IJU48_07265 [Synergistaceae bacterium]|nr:hypothetical protein [Synergistaceae bacterium]